MAASILIHAAVLSVPHFTTQPRTIEPVEVFVLDGGDSLSSGGGGNRRGFAQKVQKQGGQNPAAEKKTPVSHRRETPDGVLRGTRNPAPETTGVVTGKPVAPDDNSRPDGSMQGSAVGGAGVSGTEAVSGGAGGTGTGMGGRGFGRGGGHGSGTGDGEGGFGSPGGPRFLKRVAPEYPALARRRKLEGNVVLMVVIDASGKLVKADVVKSSDGMFAEASLEAVKKSTYLPARRNGQAVMSKALLPIRFSLVE